MSRISFLVHLFVWIWSTEGFVPHPIVPISRLLQASPSSSLLRSTTETDRLVDQLIECIDNSDGDNSDNDANSEKPYQTQTQNHNNQIKEIIDQLTAASRTNMTDFDSLIGYYNVSTTLTSRPQDNPVGGKWTRNGSTRHLWVIRRTLQHVLEKRSDSIPNAVAQAINVIRLDILFGWIPVWIVLRGDAVPLAHDDNNDHTQTTSTGKVKVLPNLSARAVRVYFDRPRIALGKLVFSLGPTSSVVLDTPYVDSKIRIGKGGTSGTLFVFRRVQDPEATTEWTWLLKDGQKYISKRKAAMVLGTLGLLSSLGYKLLDGLARTISLGGTLLSTLCLLWVALGTGGIETRGDTYAPGK